MQPRRIVVCNQQYLRMYKLSPEVVKPGCTLLALMEHRKQTGFLTRDPQQYVKEILDSIAAGKTSKWMIEASDGRKVHAINEPMPGGGWVSTHEDITEQLRLQQQHDSMAEQQKRRGFIDGGDRFVSQRNGNAAQDLRRQRVGDEIDRCRSFVRFQSYIRSVRMARWRRPTRRQKA